MSSTTNDQQGEYIAKAEANAMDRIRSVAKEAASKAAEMMIAWASVSERVVGNENILLSIKEHTDAHDKATEQAKRKEFEAIERNEYDEIMNAQEDADEAKYGEQPNREPVLGKESALSAFKEYLNGFDPETGERHIWISAVIWANKEIQAKIDSGELIIVKTVKRSECVVTSSQMEQISLLCCGRVVRNDGDDIKNGEHCRCGAIFIDDAYPSQRSLSICKNCGLCETHIPPIGSHDCPRCSAKITE